MSRCDGYSGAQRKLLIGMALWRFFITIIQAPSGTQYEIKSYNPKALFGRCVMCVCAVPCCLERTFPVFHNVKMPQCAFSHAASRGPKGHALKCHRVAAKSRSRGLMAIHSPGARKKGGQARGPFAAREGRAAGSRGASSPRWEQDTEQQRRPSKTIVFPGTRQRDKRSH